MRSTLRSALLALMTVCALGGVTATSALASGKPFVETKPPTGVTFEKATLNGVVNPNGAETKYYFEYGETTKYGNKTESVSAGSGTTNLEVSKVITGLFISKMHFRIVATNTNGTSDGADETFDTVPYAETLRPATGNTTATLYGIVTPDNVETKYYFSYGTEPGKLTKKTTEASVNGKAPVEVHQSLSGLTEGKKYYYRLIANALGESQGVQREFLAKQEPEFKNTNPFQGKAGNTVFAVGGIQYEYTKAEISGEIAANKQSVKNVTLKFIEGGSTSCNTESHNLVLTGLTGGLESINGGRERALVLEPVGEPAATQCSGWDGTTAKYEIGGAFVGIIDQIKTGELELKFKYEQGDPEAEEVFHWQLGTPGTWRCSTEAGKERCNFGESQRLGEFRDVFTLTSHEQELIN
jgi:hypothetical protein